MSGEPFEIREDGSAVIRLHVQPAAGRTAIAGRFGDALKVKVAAPPEGGRANDACAALLAEILGVKPQAVELLSGASSRSKRFAVSGLEEDDLRRLVDQALERSGSSAPGGNAKGERRVEGRR